MILLYSISVYCNDVESSSLEPHVDVDFLHSFIIPKIRQFPELWPSLGIVISLQNREQDFVYLRTNC
jgi:hypothetical protein